MRKFIDILIEAAIQSPDMEPVLKFDRSFAGGASDLDYEGKICDSYSIRVDGIVVGEITVQRGKNTITIRNALLRNDAHTGKGVGTKAYSQLRSIYPGKIIRSSYSTNAYNGHTFCGLSPQAIALWDSMVRKGLAVKRYAEDGRFFYQMV